MTSDRLERWSRPTRSSVDRWALRVLLVLGVGLLVACAITLVLTMRFVVASERATGTVIDSREEISHDSDGGFQSVYYPVVRFTTAEGRTVEFVSSSGSSDEKLVGASVEVLYDRDDPSDAQLSGFFDLWLFPLAFGGVGLCFLASGLLYPGGRLARRWSAWRSSR